MNVIRTSTAEPVSRDKIWDSFVAYCQGKSWDMSESGFDMGKDAIFEMPTFQSQNFDFWYLSNSYRYSKMRESDRRASRYIVRLFIADITTGKIKI